MQKGKKQVQPSPTTELSRELAHSRLEDIVNYLKLSQKNIATDTSLKQWDISKILNGHYKRVQGHAKIIIEYANRRAAEAGYEPRNQEAAVSRIQEAAISMWDGTPGGCESVVEVLKAIARLRQARGSNGK